MSETAASKPICSTCNDTHTMQFGELESRMCTYCPIPCRKCGQDEGRGAYCKTTPCSCVCHAKHHQYRSQENAVLEPPTMHIEPLPHEPPSITEHEEGLWDSAFIATLEHALRRSEAAGERPSGKLARLAARVADDAVFERRKRTTRGSE